MEKVAKDVQDFSTPNESRIEHILIVRSYAHLREVFKAFEESFQQNPIDHFKDMHLSPDLISSARHIGMYIDNTFFKLLNFKTNNTLSSKLQRIVY